MGGGGGGGNTTTVQKADPWKGVQPYLLTGFEQLANLYGTPQYNAKGSITGWALGQGPQYYPGSTIAQPNWLEAAGQNQQLSALSGLMSMGQAGQTGLYGLLGGAGTARAGAIDADQAINTLLAGGQNMMGAGAGMYSGAAYDMNRLADSQAQMGNNTLANVNRLAGIYGQSQATGGLNNLYDAIRMANTSGDAALAGGLGQLSQLGGAAGQFGLGQLGGGFGGLDAFGGASGQGLGMMGGAAGGLGGIGGAQQGLGGAANLGAVQALGNQLGSGGMEAGQAGALQGMQHLLGAGDVMNNPYLASAMNAAIRPVREQFTEQVMPGIRQGAMEAGQMGSSRQGVAEGIASRGYMDTIADLTAQMGSQAYGQGLQAVQAGAGIGQGLLGQGLGAAGQLGQLGQGFTGQALQALAQQGQLGQGMAALGLDATGQRLGAAQGLLGMGVGAAGQQAGLGQQLLGQQMGGAGQLLGFGQNMMGLQAQLGSGALDRATQLQNALLGGGINLAGQGMQGIGTAGQLGQGMYESGMTAAGRGLALQPQAMQSMLMPGQIQQQIGQQRTADAQAQLNANIQRWNYNQSLPFAQMSDYLALLSGAPGGTTTQYQSGVGGGSNSLMSGLGGAMTGYGMGSSLAGALGMAAGPWAWGGALLGGGLGLFG